MDESFTVAFPDGKKSLIAVYDNLIPESMCSEFIELFASNEDLAEPGKTNSGVRQNTKCSTDLVFHSSTFDIKWNDHLSELDFKFHSHLTLAFAHYQQTYQQSWVPFLFGDTGYQIQKYHKGHGFYRTHVDSTPWDEIGRDRFIAIIVYLNDVDHGGETHFPLHGVSVKPKRGRVCLFPATWTHPHAALVPFSNDKYIISTFVVAGPLMENFKVAEPEQTGHIDVV